MAKFAAKDSNKNITLSPHGSGKVVVGTGSTDATVQSDGNHNLVLQTGNSTTGSISITDGADGNIAITPNGTGEVDISKVDIDAGAIDGVTIGTNSAVTDLRVDNIKVDGNTISSTNTDGNISITPNGAGEVYLPKVNIDSGNIDATDVNMTSGTLTTSTAQKQAIVQAGPGSGTLDVSSGTFTTSTAQKQAIVDGATIEAQDLASGSGTSLPNNVQDAITRLGTVTSGTFEGTISGSASMASSGLTVRNISQEALGSDQLVVNSTVEQTVFNPTYTPLFSGSKVQGIVQLVAQFEAQTTNGRKTFKFEYEGTGITNITQTGEQLFGNYDFGNSGVVGTSFYTITGPLLTTSSTAQITMNLKGTNMQAATTSYFNVYGNNTMEETFITWIEYK